MTQIVEATQEHVDALAADMRMLDQDEVQALGMTPYEALHEGKRTSVFTHAALDDEGRPYAMWGVCGAVLLSDRAMVWFLSGSRLPKHRRDVMHWSRTFIEEMQRRYTVLECIVDLRYDAAVRWVKWLGFEPSAQFSMGGTLFHVMQRRRA